MTPLLYDNVDTGHHRGYLAGLVAAAEDQGLDYLVASVSQPVSMRNRSRWIPVEPAPLRSVVRNHAALRGATRRAIELGADGLIDLYLDKQIWSSGAAAGMTAKVHVLHHAEQLSYKRRTGAARLRTTYLRNRLQRIAAKGDVVGVHNDKTAHIIDGLVHPNQIVRIGYPIAPFTGERLPSRSDPPTLLFVGAGRHEKGLDLLLAALAANPGMAQLRIVGRQHESTRSRLTAEHPDVQAEWLDRFVDDDTLRAEYEQADLAVLPYRSTFGDHGGPSSVLLETLGAGVPIVTTSALADQLPPGYSGAVVSASDSVPALHGALKSALANLDQLTAEAHRSGPHFIADNHTFSTYLNHLLRALELAGF